MSLFFVDTSKDYTERFDMERFMRYTDNLDPLTSAFQKDLSALPVSGRFTVQGEEQRPDLISYKIYGRIDLWWVILLYNGIFEISEVTTEKQLVFPSAESLDDLFFRLKAQETASAVG